MKTYRVRWEIDLEADSPRQAAEKAREVQLRPGSIATVYEVASHGAPNDFETVDLEEGEAANDAR